jgi:hypothetical protein
MEMVVTWKETSVKGGIIIHKSIVWTWNYCFLWHFLFLVELHACWELLMKPWIFQGSHDWLLLLRCLESDLVCHFLQ